ncbi:TIGR03790 family protein [Rhodocyclus tenuis]|uniref:TIGR03790 family protein n=1 Tax=Rhodocyclus tenuis TaxID=1066 RepID=A0A6L5K1B0_RHOTE|nr:TIGR03790 family protein [Rhodocyclus gracilis]MQY52298.1 TIGR03790 family protein [Rhodocyclus gracilis]
MQDAYHADVKRSLAHGRAAASDHGSGLFSPSCRSDLAPHSTLPPLAAQSSHADPHDGYDSARWERRINAAVRPIRHALQAFIVGLLFSGSVGATPLVSLPRSGLNADELALLVNDADPQSRQVADYYQKARGIPDAHVIHLRFNAERSAFEKDEFIALKREIDAATPESVQAYAVTWTTPYRVACMSLTSALAFGFHERYCSTQCSSSAASPYFNSASLSPAQDYRLRPAMMLAGRSVAEVKALIDRGVAADGTQPRGRAYLLSTSDAARNSRAAGYTRARTALAGILPVEIRQSDVLADAHDVLFYFTGLARVTQLDSLHFLPGALADHLTSFGGQLTDSGQMSSLRWLEAGATASYGTVVEPCNHPQKFPLPAVAMLIYASGATALEAYWKSVQWPGEGLFIGEPLARPFAPTLHELAPGEFELRLFSLGAGQVRLLASASPMGPFVPVRAGLSIRPGNNVLRFSLPIERNGYVRLLWP